MIQREILQEVLELLNYFPAVGIIGPRQCGKTTLVREIAKEYEKDCIYIDLESHGDIQKLFVKPYHPYTKGLIASVPVVEERRRKLSIIKGMVPNLIYPPTGCRFHPRCDFCFKPCDSNVPKSIEIEPNYYVACHLYDPQYKDLVKEKLRDDN